MRSVKFLFLPTEHDPDSFIREHGKEAFARYVGEALPLSRFLVDAARDGCDLNTAEGRAHMASNAKPLWSLLPEGALKLQLLGELADQVQLTARELSELWSPAPAKGSKKSVGGSANSYQNNSYSRYKTEGYSQKSPSNFMPKPRLSGRVAPNSRADHAVRLLLGHSATWDSLSTEDHALLCALPAPHGPLLTWLESQLHEHGPQAWAALREGLQDHPSQALALQLMSGPAMDGTADLQRETLQELRNLVNRMLVEQLKMLETEAIEASKADPSALERYRELQARRRALETAR